MLRAVLGTAVVLEAVMVDVQQLEAEVEVAVVGAGRQVSLLGRADPSNVSTSDYLLRVN